MSAGRFGGQMFGEHLHGNAPRWDTEGIERKYISLHQTVDWRVPVYFLHDANSMYLPTALGMMHAQICKSQAAGDLANYRLVAAWDLSLEQIAGLASRFRPGVWLFSDYLWTLETNLWLSRQVKLYSPDSVVIHGGPSAPNYEGASQQFLLEHPEVDVIVRGEGEDTILELLGALASCRSRADWSPLRSVEAIIFHDRATGKVVRTGNRQRAHLDQLASPYLDGSFDDYGAPVVAATIETNRGCPYGCTFCDWGSATLQKIRNFDLDRVKAEIEWAARHKIKILWIADANFGILERDVEIAEHISRLRMERGYPRQVVVNYAKNATRRIAEIVRIFRKCDVTGQGIIAIQTTDEQTLKVIRRENIKSERYDELMAIFQREQLALSTDLIVGLPGSTVESFKRDLQHYFDRHVALKIFDSILLPNSPMADPDYMKQFEIEVDSDGIVIATSTFSKEEKRHMTALSKFYNILVEYGLLRYILYYVQWTHQIRSVDVIEHLVRTAKASDSQSPNLRWLAEQGWPKPMPPGGWRGFYSEVERALSKLGVESDLEFATVIAVNSKVMPDQQRKFPEIVDLPFDFVRYFRDQSDPEATKRRLSDYGSGTLAISDPQNLCEEVFANTFLYGMHTIHWELDSDLRTSGMIPKLNQAFEVAAPSLIGK